MGNRPSRPDAFTKGKLERARGELITRAACAISHADAIVVFTGAGFSACSGLPVYVDVADVPAYNARNLKYHDLCDPSFQQQEPELFAGFWGGCMNAYRDTRPHDGYAIVSSWRAHRASPDFPTFFSFTSNVDHHWASVLPRELFFECHGNLELNQCASRACAEALLAEGAAGGLDRGRWAVPPAYRMAVDEDTRLAPADVPPAAGAEHAVGSAQPFDGGAFARNHPACVRCGGPARPNVLMFNDEVWLANEEEFRRWDAFRGALVGAAGERAEEGGEPLRVALLEVGAGGNVTTVRRTAEALLLDLEGAGAEPTLIRVNPELPLGDSAAARPRVLPILSKGLAAVREIDAAIRSAAGDAFVGPLKGLRLDDFYGEAGPQAGSGGGGGGGGAQ
jgi:NAD-dependent SIR2 family protein deacetylase